MTRRILTSFCLLIFMATASTGFARVTGLPDFTVLAEEARPAVVNIQVTKFGERVRNTHPEQGDQNPYDQQQIPEFFRRFFDTPWKPRPWPARPAWHGIGIHF